MRALDPLLVLAGAATCAGLGVVTVLGAGSSSLPPAVAAGLGAGGAALGVGLVGAGLLGCLGRRREAPRSLRRRAAWLAVPAAVGVVGALSFALADARGREALEQLRAEVESELASERAAASRAARPTLASLSRPEDAPRDEDALPLYERAARELAALAGEGAPGILDKPPGPERSAELARRRPVLELALRAASAPRCDHAAARPAPGPAPEALDLVPDLLAAEALERAANDGDSVDGAPSAVAALRAIADLELHGASFSREPVLEALGDIAARNFVEARHLSLPADGPVGALARDLEALERTFPDARARLRRRWRTVASRVTGFALPAGSPAEIFGRAGVELPGPAALRLFCWLPVHAWAARGVADLRARYAAGEEIAGTADLARRRSRADAGRDTARPGLDELLRSQGVDNTLWRRLRPDARSCAAEHELARVRLVRAAATIEVDGEASLPDDPLLPGRKLRRRSASDGFCVVAGLALEDAPGTDAQPRGTVETAGFFAPEWPESEGEVTLHVGNGVTSAVEAGLYWILRHQEADGSLAPEPAVTGGVAPPPSARARETALAALAIDGVSFGAGPGSFGAGEVFDAHDGKVRQLSRALQQALGWLAHASPAAPGDAALVSLALTEGSRADGSWRAPAADALRRLEAALGASPDAKPAELGWAALAFSLATRRGLSPAPASLERLRERALALAAAGAPGLEASAAAVILAPESGSPQGAARVAGLLDAIGRAPDGDPEPLALSLAALSVVRSPRVYADKRVKPIPTKLGSRQATARAGDGDGAFPPRAPGRSTAAETGLSIVLLEQAYGYVGALGASPGE